jgi:hypothetical protein
MAKERILTVVVGQKRNFKRIKDRRKGEYMQRLLILEGSIEGSK